MDPGGCFVLGCRLTGRGRPQQTQKPKEEGNQVAPGGAEPVMIVVCHSSPAWPPRQPGTGSPQVIQGPVSKVSPTPGCPELLPPQQACSILGRDGPAASFFLDLSLWARSCGLTTPLCPPENSAWHEFLGFPPTPQGSLWSTAGHASIRMPPGGLLSNPKVHNILTDGHHLRLILGWDGGLYPSPAGFEKPKSF